MNPIQNVENIVPGEQVVRQMRQRFGAPGTMPTQGEPLATGRGDLALAILNRTGSWLLRMAQV